MAARKGCTLNITNNETGVTETLRFNDASEYRLIALTDDSQLHVDGKLPLKQCRQAIRQFAREQAEKQDSGELMKMLEQQFPGINPENILQVIEDLKYDESWAKVRGDKRASRFAFTLVFEMIGATVRRTMDRLSRPITQWQFRPASTTDGVLTWLFRGGRS